MLASLISGRKHTAMFAIDAPLLTALGTPATLASLSDATLDCCRGPGGRIRGVPPSRQVGQEGRGNGTRSRAVSEVRRAAWRAHLGEEPDRRGVDVHVYPSGTPWRTRPEQSRRLERSLIKKPCTPGRERHWALVSRH